MRCNSTELIIILSISLLLNLAVLLAGGVFLWRKGGINYLRRQRSPQSAFNRSPYYLHRQQQFERLKTTSGSIIFLGDSITNEGEWSDWFSQVKVHNRGISGDTIAGVIDRLDAVLTPPPTKLFLMIGINDLLSGTSIEALTASYQKLLAKIHAEAPETVVFVQSILPICPQLCITAVTNESIAAANQNLLRIADEFSYPYIDLFHKFCDDQGWLDRQYTLDGLHLNGLAYQHWQQQIALYVQPVESTSSTDRSQP